MLEYFAFCIALVAVVYSVILIQPGMLLAPVYQKLQTYVVRKYDRWPEEIFWLKPLISCALCVAGQWAFWGYIIRYYQTYNLFEHLYVTALSIMLAAVLRKLYLWTKQ